jgi:hypothetical protein
LEVAFILPLGTSQAIFVGWHPPNHTRKGRLAC